MKRICTITAVALAFVALPAERAEAQINLGVQGLYATDAPAPSLEGGVAGLGGRLGLDLPMVGLGVSGDFNWYFPDCADGSCDQWELVGNVTYSFVDVSPVSPYIGAGVVFQNVTEDPALPDALDEGEAGLNILGGLAIGGVSPVNLYGEVGYRIMDQFENQVVLALGLVF